MAAFLTAPDYCISTFTDLATDEETSVKWVSRAVTENCGQMPRFRRHAILSLKCLDAPLEQIWH